MKTRFATALLVSLFGMLPFAAQEARTQATSCFVTTTQGSVQGADLGVSCAFLGIPFAAPPIGNLRWKPPQPADPWAPATLNATAASPPCAQLLPPRVHRRGGHRELSETEHLDARSRAHAPAPVIVWIHTGAFQATSGNFADSNPRQLVERTGARRRRQLSARAVRVHGTSRSHR